MQIESSGFTAGCDAQNNDALGHSGEQEVGLFNRPCMGPAVVVNQQFSQRVGGLLAQQTVGRNDSQSSTVFENLKAAFNEQTVEVHVASHG